MRLLRRLTGGLRATISRTRLQQELDDELQQFLQASIDAKLAAGMSRADAERAARLELGSPAAVKDCVHDVGWETRFESVWQDVRYALRMLRRSPGFAIAAITTFALGIGANTAIFSIVDAAILRPLPYDEPERLFRIHLRHTEGRLRDNTIPRDFLDWRERSDLFEAVATTAGGAYTLVGFGDPERFRVTRASAGFFELYRTSPHLGRFFSRHDERPGHDRVVVLGYEFWRTRFAARPDVIGATLTLDGQAFEVIGVTRQDFVYPANSARPETLFLPRTFTPEDRASGVIQSMATGVNVRLRDGVSVDQAEAAITQLLSAADARKHSFNKGYRRAEFVPMIEGYVARSRTWMLMLFGAVTLVLLIACANVANLVLAHGATRIRELTVRAAIGASRARIRRPLLAESLILSLIGGGTGVLVAWVSIHFLKSTLPASIPRAFSVSLDARVLAFTGLVAIGTGLLCGVVPAWQGSRVDLNRGLRDVGGYGATASASVGRTRRALVLAEITLAVMLLVGAGLFISSFIRLLRVDHGFDASGVTVVGYDLPRHVTGSLAIGTVRDLLAAVRSVPGVQAEIVVAGDGPYVGSSSSFPLRVVGRPAQEGQDIRYKHVSEGFLNLLRVPLVRGRSLSPADEDGPPVAVINETAARQFWGESDPLGDRLEINKTVYEIVGVAGDMRYTGPTSPPVPEVYLPYTRRSGSGSLLIRSGHPTSAILPAIKAAIWSVLPGRAVSDVTATEDVFRRSTLTRRFNMLLMSIFAGLALVIAATGIYGVIAFVVTQRTREIGVRLALGAGPHAVVRLFVAQGGLIIAAGIVAGLTGAWWLAHTVQGFLFEVQPRDPLVFTIVALFLGMVGLLACWIPARRAASVDPLIALRAE